MTVPLRTMKANGGLGGLEPLAEAMRLCLRRRGWRERRERREMWRGVS
jgi:hypothetical protein